MYRVGISFILLFSAPFCNVIAQSDTIIVYDVRSQEIDLLPPPEIDGSQISDYTEWNVGTHPGVIDLPIEPPLHTPSNSGFTDFVPAQNFFDVTDYPVRTAVKLFRFVDDTLMQNCSGIMISSNLVLTAAHCIFFLFDSGNMRTFADSILAIPAYNNGMEQPEFGSSVSWRYYIPKKWYDRTGWEDIGLIELEEPIGLQTGWIGIAFTDDDSLFHENVFHKLSYPAAVDLTDSTRVFNGDTLYYNYGTLDLISSTTLGYNITGIQGQSGSSLFYTDNNVYYTFGILGWAYGSRHHRINREVFYSFQNIIDNVTSTGEPYVPHIIQKFTLKQNYPNPFNPSTNISFEIPLPDIVNITIYDVLGRKVKTLLNDQMPAGQHSVIWNGIDAYGNPVSSGTYFYRMSAGNEYIKSKKMLLVR